MTQFSRTRLRRCIAPVVRLAAATGLLLATTAAAPPPDRMAAALHAHVAFLADDLLEGRGLGTRGHEIAARYVAAQFAAFGLQPAGTDGFFQRVNFVESRFTSARETLTLTRGAATQVWSNGVEATMTPGTTAGTESFAAPLIFVGYGLKDARLGIDDYAGLDVTGKIVVALSGSPPGMDTEIGAHLARSKTAFAAAAGAIGVVQVRTLAGAARQPWSKGLAAARQARRSLIGPDGNVVGDGTSLRLRAALDDGPAAALFDGAAQSFAQVRTAAAQGLVKGFPLIGNIGVERAMATTQVSSPNILALLPGSSPGLADQIVLISAHLDHLGMRPELKGDTIFNGALDNASGVATLIEAARALAAGRAPKRSVLFLVTTGEESGLLGADYFSRQPTVRLDRVVAEINIDMPILTCDFGDIIAFGAQRSTIATAVRDAAKAEGLTLSPDPQPEEAIFTRSDHYPLVRAGVPAVFLKTGWHDAKGGLTCRDAERDFRLKHYHEVSDDLSLPIDWAVGAKFARLNTGIIRRLADARDAPRWTAGDYFGETFAAGAVKAGK